MGKPQLTLYVDLVSPFAYLAFHILRTSAVFAACETTYIPVFLGGIMNKTNNRPPITIKNKDKWIDRERLRWARKFNVPMHHAIPPGFPVNSLTVQRALTALSLAAPAQFPATVAALYAHYFVDHAPLARIEDFMPVFVRVAGAEVAATVEGMIGSQEIKDRLLANTDRAIADGAFGLPWFNATNSEGVTEGFWGVDHLGQVAEFLGLERPGAGSEAEGGWRSLL